MLYHVIPPDLLGIIVPFFMGVSSSQCWWVRGIIHGSVVMAYWSNEYANAYVYVDSRICLICNLMVHWSWCIYIYILRIHSRSRFGHSVVVVCLSLYIYIYVYTHTHASVYHNMHLATSDCLLRSEQVWSVSSIKKNSSLLKFWTKMISGWWFKEHGWMIFPFSWECHHPNWLSLHHFSEG